MTGHVCALCGTEDRIQVTSRRRVRPWSACRRCLRRATVLARRTHRPSDLAHRASRARDDGYEVWSSEAHVYILGQEEADRLRTPRVALIAGV